MDDCGSLPRLDLSSAPPARPCAFEDAWVPAYLSPHPPSLARFSTPIVSTISLSSSVKRVTYARSKVRCHGQHRQRRSRAGQDDESGATRKSLTCLQPCVCLAALADTALALTRQVPGKNEKSDSCATPAIWGGCLLAGVF